MKLSVTKEELLQILSNHFGQSVSECTILKVPSLHRNIIDSLMKDLKIPIVGAGVLNVSNLKIPAIKSLRSITGAGLGEAKWAIEHWDEWIGCVKKNGRLPTFRGDYTTGYYIS